MNPDEGFARNPIKSHSRHPAAKVDRIVAKPGVVVFPPKRPAVHIAWPSGLIVPHISLAWLVEFASNWMRPHPACLDRGAKMVSETHERNRPQWKAGARRATRRVCSTRIEDRVAQAADRLPVWRSHRKHILQCGDPDHRAIVDSTNKAGFPSPMATRLA